MLVSEAGARCTDDSDLFLGVIGKVTAWVTAFSSAGDDRERFALVRDLGGLKLGRGGRAGNWPDLPGLKNECKELAADASAVAKAYGDAALRPLARWIAAAVLDDARARVASGALEFHDLLVASRDLLRTNADARAELQATYRRLLLDEFQDTDPIQIELAVRIAGGREADAEDWRDVDGASRLAVRRRRPEAVDLPLPPREHLHVPRRGPAARTPTVARHELPHGAPDPRLGERRLRRP